MMKSTKTFDCVKLKNDIQASLYHERKGMSQAEIHTAIDQKLATAQTPLAATWRRLSKAEHSRMHPHALSL